MGIAALCAYSAIIIWLGYSDNKKTSLASFFVNRRSSTPLAVAISIIVSCVGASATIGMVGLAFKVGTPAFWWLGAGAMGLSILGLLLAKKVRESGAYTMPELVENLLGKTARPLISCIIVLAWIAILAAQFSALGKVLQSLTQFSSLVCMAIAFVLVVGHTIGGQAAIMRVDKIQFLLIVGALTVILVWLSAVNPQWAGNVNLEISNQAFPASKLIYFLLVVGGNYLVCPMLFGRFLSAKDTASARKGGIIAAAGLALCAVLIVCIGLACIGLIPQSTADDAVLTTAVSTLMPGWLNILLLIALVSAIVSSADSCLITASTVLSYDLLRRKNIQTCRACVVLLGLGGLLVSSLGKGILAYLLMAYDIYACGVVVPVFIGLLLAKTRFKIKPRFACGAIVFGGIFGAISGIGGINEMSYVGMLGAALICFIGLLPLKSVQLGRNNLAGTTETGREKK